MPRLFSWLVVEVGGCNSSDKVVYNYYYVCDMPVNFLLLADTVSFLHILFDSFPPNVHHPFLRIYFTAKMFVLYEQ